MPSREDVAPARRVLPAFAALVVLSNAFACKDQAKESAALARENVTHLAVLVEKDVAEVVRGMPEGAKRLTPLVTGGSDPRKDVAGVRKALVRVRASVGDLAIAKSTFFALADPTGVAIRNDLEEDVMAGQDLVSVFPPLAGAKDGLVTATGAFPNAVSKNGPDPDWIAAVPVKREDGSAGAIFVTGWTYRYFARHLQESLKDQLADEAKTSQRKMPVAYVALFDKAGVYSAPLTPAVDEKALLEQDLSSKTAGGPAEGTVTITDRAFGWAALRTPKISSDTGVVVLRSEL
jgi:hypothetical protein